MNTILVPVDFSATAVNAAKYAVQFAKQTGTHKVVLFNAFELPVVSDGGLTIPIVTGTDDMKISSTNKLKTLQQDLINEFDVFFPIEIKNSFNTVVTGIKEAANEVNADFIIMGITGGTAIEEVLIGSNSVDVAKNINKPVLIIPPHVQYKLIRNIVLSCDFKNIVETTPLDDITEVINATKSHLHLLYVDVNDQIESYEGTYFESMAVTTLFGSFNPQYHFVKNANFVEGVNSFVDENEIDIVIAIPKKHSFIESLFHKSHTNTLAFHSHVPLLMVHIN